MKTNMMETQHDEKSTRQNPRVHTQHDHMTLGRKTQQDETQTNELQQHKIDETQQHETQRVEMQNDKTQD